MQTSNGLEDSHKFCILVHNFWYASFILKVRAAATFMHYVLEKISMESVGFKTYLLLVICMFYEIFGR